ncbi:hypothetical protein QTG56_24580 (plasmid) [Rossellomorea sp. AcN35-11]|nr:hypothetical protein [Rossellomorea aquimaris]WJV31812.1 hypothetical protein QTG56_24580 [Rossellomorea sp. AcN35-11]
MRNEHSSDFILASLSSFKSEFDETMKYMRTKMEQNPNPSLGWILKPFFFAFISFKVKIKEGEVKNFVTDLLGSTYFTVIFMMILGMKELNLPWGEIPFSDNLYLILVIGSYMVSVIHNFHRLTRIRDERFDISAYAFIKKEEFQLFQHYKEAKPFTFNNLYDHLRDLTNATIKEIQGFKEHMVIKDEHLWEKEERIKKLSEQLEKEEEANESLLKKLEELVSEYKRQNQLFNHTIDSVQSMNQDCLSKDDLRVITDYSLFEEFEGKLHRIAHHKTANTPKIIDPEHSKYRKWAVSRVYHSTDDVIELDESHGRVIASKKFVTPNGTFVYSFHFHESAEEIYAIIEKEELHRLLYVLVLFYKDTPAYLKEVEEYGIS